MGLTSGTVANLILNTTTTVSTIPKTPLHEIAFALRRELLTVDWKSELAYLVKNFKKDLWYSSDIVREGQADFVMSSWTQFKFFSLDFGFGSPVDFDSDAYLGPPNVGQLMQEGDYFKVQLALFADDLKAFKNFTNTVMVAHDIMAEIEEAEVVDEFNSDWSDWARLKTTIWKYSLTAADSLLLVVVNVTLLLTSVWVGIAGFLFVGPLIQFLYPRITRPIRIKAAPENASVIAKYRSFLPSSVSASAPTFFEEYENLILSPGVFERIGAKLRNPYDENPNRRPPFDQDIARLFIHLCALVYENQDVIRSVADSWGLQVEFIQKELSALFIFYSPSEKFVIVLARGVNPFDLSEILINATIQKVRPEAGVLPGLIHEGFYNMISWNTESSTLIIEEENETGTKTGLDVSELVRILREEVLPKIPGEPAIWFTGHSLGAALSTLVLSHLVHINDSLITSQFVKGCYTFGSPKCGDTEFVSVTAKQLKAARVVLYRVINANDPVVAFPIGGHTGGLALAISESQREGIPTVCHSDFRHIGVPVSLHCDGLKFVGKDRDLEALIKNGVFWVGDFIPSIARFVRGKDPFIALAQKLFPFPYDHLPVQYDRHLNQYQNLLDSHWVWAGSLEAYDISFHIDNIPVFGKKTIDHICNITRYLAYNGRKFKHQEQRISRILEEAKSASPTVSLQCHNQCNASKNERLELESLLANTLDNLPRDAVIQQLNELQNMRAFQNMVTSKLADELMQCETALQGLESNLESLEQGDAMASFDNLIATINAVVESLEQRATNRIKRMEQEEKELDNFLQLEARLASSDLFEGPEAWCRRMMMKALEGNQELIQQFEQRCLKACLHANDSGQSDEFLASHLKATLEDFKISRKLDEESQDDIKLEDDG
ncbi:hypothetical protein HDU97_005695 [Phlyctochytrium planicorne]|nr:hypothetical protein HDU97_005695 [Phlyctochytrium planicorne]